MDIDEWVIVGRAGDADLVIATPLQDSNNPEYVVAEVAVRTPQLMAKSRIEFSQEWGQGWGGLVRFFDELAASWQGWRGVKDWTDDHANVSIAAMHDGKGLVQLEVSIARQSGYTGPGSWELHAAIPEEPGRIEHIAAGLRRFQPV
jgi:Family of unknown function (DUF6228)